MGSWARSARPFPHTSQVLLINDPTSGAGVLLASTRIRAILRGNQTGHIVITNLTPDSRIKPGESVLTSGGDQIYPRGLSVGTIESIAPDPDHQPYTIIQIKPSTNLFQLEEVLVITGTRNDLSPLAKKDLAQGEARAKEMAAAKAAADEAAAEAAAQSAAQIISEKLPSIHEGGEAPGDKASSRSIQPNRCQPGAEATAGASSGSLFAGRDSPGIVAQARSRAWCDRVRSPAPRPQRSAPQTQAPEGEGDSPAVSKPPAPTERNPDLRARSQTPINYAQPELYIPARARRAQLFTCRHASCSRGGDRAAGPAVEAVLAVLDAGSPSDRGDLLCGLAAQPPVGTLTGAAIGLVQDALTGRPIGVNGMAKSVIGYIVASIGVQVRGGHVISIDTFSSLVDAIYDAGLHSEKWQHSLEQLTAAIGGNVADFKLTDAARARVTVNSIGLDPKAIDRYLQYYGKIDPILPATERKPVGALTLDQEVVPKNWLMRTEFYNDWVRPQDFHDCAVLTLVRDETRLGILCLAAPERADAFGLDQWIYSGG